MSEPILLLEMNSVTAGYHGSEVLNGVSLILRERDVVTIVGPNGAGKSTVLKTIMGYLTPSSGEVRFRGTSLAGIAPEERVKRGIAYVPQVDNVFPSLTVGENMRMGGYLLPREEIGRRMERLYAEFPLLGERNRQRAQTLSGGQRQLLAIARALMTDPQAILLDEPSAALSPRIADEVFDKVTAIRDGGTAVLIVEQAAERSLAISDRGYVLVDGRNAFEGPAQSILNDEKMRGAFLGAQVDG